jgi:hypothetical protein
MLQQKNYDLLHFSHNYITDYGLKKPSETFRRQYQSRLLRTSKLSSCFALVYLASIEKYICKYIYKFISINVMLLTTV